MACRALESGGDACRGGLERWVSPDAFADRVSTLEERSRVGRRRPHGEEAGGRRARPPLDGAVQRLWRSHRNRRDRGGLPRGRRGTTRRSC